MEESIKAYLITPVKDKVKPDQPAVYDTGVGEYGVFQ